MSDKNWANDRLQFTRLLAEIASCVEFTEHQSRTLCESMGLEWTDIQEILDRATTAFDAVKPQILSDTIDFGAILERIESVVSAKPDPNFVMQCELLENRPASHKYRLTVSEALTQTLFEMTDTDMITRCDNKALDVRNEPGLVCHFGGYVERVSPTEALVTVWVD